ncbi:hypothetical protein EBT16_04540 [bacterium]|nr:hypothetical protein [bacterium]
MWKQIWIITVLCILGRAQDHGGGEAPLNGERPVENTVQTSATSVSQFLSLEVGKALIENKGDIKKAVQSLTNSTHEEAEKALGEALGVIKDKMPQVALIVEDRPALQKGEMKFIADVLSDVKLKENAKVSQFLKDNPAIFCAFSQTPEGDFKRTCINVTELATKIMDRMTTGDLSGVFQVVSEIKDTAVYEETIDFEKYADVWAGKSADDVYEWSLNKLEQIPIESKAINILGKAIALRNGFIKAVTDSDLEKADEYVERMQQFRDELADQPFNFERKDKDISRNITVSGITPSELKSRVEKAKDSQNTWWWWKKR